MVLKVDVSELQARLKDLEWATGNLQRAWLRVPVEVRKRMGHVSITLCPEEEGLPAAAEVIELEGRVRHEG